MIGFFMILPDMHKESVIIRGKVVEKVDSVMKSRKQFYPIFNKKPIHMKIPDIDYTDFKTLEGELNTFIIMTVNDKETLSMGELLDFIDKQPITSREKIQLAISAMVTINNSK